VPWKKSVVEIDIYHGSNDGLIVGGLAKGVALTWRVVQRWKSG